MPVRDLRQFLDLLDERGDLMAVGREVDPVFEVTAYPILGRYPWVVWSMRDAFERSKRVCHERMKDPRRFQLAWFMESMREQTEILGDDPWKYGVDENLHTLETLCDYALDQELVRKRPVLEEMFVHNAIR